MLVSGTNQYSVNPLALVSTVAPPIMAVFTTLDAVLPDPALPPLPDPVLVPELLELPHPVAISAAAASPTGTSHLLLIAILRSLDRVPPTR